MSLMNSQENADLHKPFPIISICRADLQTRGLTNEQLALLTDDAMLAIVQQLAALYDPSVFWEEVTFLARTILIQKQW
jgi:hypothetical protein